MSDTTTGIVVFQYSTWGALYPELAASVNAQQAQFYFNQACNVLPNYPTSPIPILDSTGTRQVRAEILGLGTSHIVALFGPNSTDAVGRVDQATQGSVSVHLDMGPTGLNDAWWKQTKYGAMCWQALAPYRSFRFFAAPKPYLGVGMVGTGPGGSWASTRGTSYKGYFPWIS